MAADKLIPVECAAITETRYLKGWYVAWYDHEGMTSGGKWFAEWKAAMEYWWELGTKRG